MPDLNTKRNKHLSLEDRQEIQECLEKGMPFKAIARRIGKNPTTVSRAVKKHLIVKEAPARYSKVDGTSIEGKQCPALLKTPFVCNPCKKRHSFCAFQKQFYYAKPAHQAYARNAFSSSSVIFRWFPPLRPSLHRPERPSLQYNETNRLT